MNAQLLDAEDGDQIVVFPVGFEIEADEVEITKDGARVILSPVAAGAALDLEG